MRHQLSNTSFFKGNLILGHSAFYLYQNSADNQLWWKMENKEKWDIRNSFRKLIRAMFKHKLNEEQQLNVSVEFAFVERCSKPWMWLHACFQHVWRLVVPTKVLLLCGKCPKFHAPGKQARNLGAMGWVTGGFWKKKCIVFQTSQAFPLKTSQNNQ